MLTVLQLIFARVPSVRRISEESFTNTVWISRLGFATQVSPNPDYLGNLLLADTMNHAVRWIDGDTGELVTILGDGIAATLDAPIEGYGGSLRFLPRGPAGG